MSTTNTPSLSFTIAAVERDTGLSKDVLRVWERRYGFPAPDRDMHGERVYPLAQVERLRTIRRLMDQGHRPGRLLRATPDELATLRPRVNSPATRSPDVPAPDVTDLLELIRRHDAPAFQQAMQQRLARDGLHRFVQDTVAPLTRRVGEAWERGQVEVFEEHLFTELTKRLLRQAVSTLPSISGRPRILLTTVPDEPHELGLLMVEALFALEGAECIPLGTQVPVLDIARATRAHAAQVVALSFSSAFPARQVPDLLEQLRLALPTGVELWAGGSGGRHAAALSGVCTLASFSDALAALSRWRASHP